MYSANATLWLKNGPKDGIRVRGNVPCRFVSSSDMNSVTVQLLDSRTFTVHSKMVMQRHISDQEVLRTMSEPQNFIYFRGNLMNQFLTHVLKGTFKIQNNCYVYNGEMGDAQRFTNKNVIIQSQLLFTDLLFLVFNDSMVLKQVENFFSAILPLFELNSSYIQFLTLQTQLELQFVSLNVNSDGLMKFKCNTSQEACIVVKQMFKNLNIPKTVLKQHLVLIPSYGLLAQQFNCYVKRELVDSDQMVDESILKLLKLKNPCFVINPNIEILAKMSAHLFERYVQITELEINAELESIVNKISSENVIDLENGYYLFPRYISEQNESKLNKKERQELEQFLQFAQEQQNIQRIKTSLVNNYQKQNYQLTNYVKQNKIQTPIAKRQSPKNTPILASSVQNLVKSGTYKFKTDQPTTPLNEHLFKPLNETQIQLKTVDQMTADINQFVTEYEASSDTSADSIQPITPQKRQFKLSSSNKINKSPYKSIFDEKITQKSFMQPKITQQIESEPINKEHTQIDYNQFQISKKEIHGVVPIIVRTPENIKPNINSNFNTIIINSDNLDKTYNQLSPYQSMHKTISTPNIAMANKFAFNNNSPKQQSSNKEVQQSEEFNLKDLDHTNLQGNDKLDSDVFQTQTVEKQQLNKIDYTEYIKIPQAPVQLAPVQTHISRNMYESKSEDNNQMAKFLRGQAINNYEYNEQIAGFNNMNQNNNIIAPTSTIITVNDLLDESLANEQQTQGFTSVQPQSVQFQHNYNFNQYENILQQPAVDTKSYDYQLNTIYNNMRNSDYQPIKKSLSTGHSVRFDTQKQSNQKSVKPRALNLDLSESLFASVHKTTKMPKIIEPAYVEEPYIPSAPKKKKDKFNAEFEFESKLNAFTQELTRTQSARKSALKMSKMTPPHIGKWKTNLNIKENDENLSPVEFPKQSYEYIEQKVKAKNNKNEDIYQSKLKQIQSNKGEKSEMENEMEIENVFNFNQLKKIAKHIQDLEEIEQEIQKEITTEQKPKSKTIPKGFLQKSSIQHHSNFMDGFGAEVDL
ncbi:Hypothetical_protein [Hexamita inflata]|uniref:Hypothetical_protein n=1 Tax=Hexamita inflata TaxID=28002 RepID=A0AA86Q2X9_9EUKA|nr:Hypothetical protein HINF_LOCUS32124 [Hexamita inflata]